MVRIAAAGNVEVPAFLVLRRKGFEVTVSGEKWTASREGLTLFGDGPIELLGLASIHEVRGDHWKASDDEIEDFLSKYPQV